MRKDEDDERRGTNTRYQFISSPFSHTAGSVVQMWHSFITNTCAQSTKCMCSICIDLGRILTVHTNQLFSRCSEHVFSCRLQPLWADGDITGQEHNESGEDWPYDDGCPVDQWSSEEHAEGPKPLWPIRYWPYAEVMFQYLLNYRERVASLICFHICYSF